MKMAKPSEKDIQDAEKLMQILQCIGENNRWSVDLVDDETPDFFALYDEDEFNADIGSHCQALYNELSKLLYANPAFYLRVISGMCHVIMWDKNEILDPNSRTIDLHPRFQEMHDDLQRETQAARYWNMRYHQVLAERVS